MFVLGASLMVAGCYASLRSKLVVERPDIAFVVLTGYGLAVLGGIAWLLKLVT